jgi:antitoxin (DNA-binding transcriptional repressor) of toxin-antitoxin stability system
VKTITIRDLRQRWPEAEKALQTEDELIITRDGKPVAKLVRFVGPRPRRKRWSAQAHLRWLKKIWGNRVFNSVDAAMARDRADRWEDIPE